MPPSLVYSIRPSTRFPLSSTTPISSSQQSFFHLLFPQTFHFHHLFPYLFHFHPVSGRGNQDGAFGRGFHFHSPSHTPSTSTPSSHNPSDSPPLATTLTLPFLPTNLPLAPLLPLPANLPHFFLLFPPTFYLLCFLPQTFHFLFLPQTFHLLFLPQIVHFLLPPQIFHFSSSSHTPLPPNSTPTNNFRNPLHPQPVHRLIDFVFFLALNQVRRPLRVVFLSNSRHRALHHHRSGTLAQTGDRSFLGLSLHHTSFFHTSSLWRAPRIELG